MKPDEDRRDDLSGRHEVPGATVPQGSPTKIVGTTQWSNTETEEASCRNEARRRSSGRRPARRGCSARRSRRNEARRRSSGRPAW